MIDNYIEKDIRRKISIIDLLYGEHITSNELTKLLNVSRATIINDIKEVNNYKADEFKICSGKNGYWIEASVDLEKLRKIIYQQSIFIKILLFLMHSSDINYIQFTLNEYISIAHFYSQRNKVLRFLNAIDLGFDNNGITGDELRIRFLYAYLEMKTGIIICEHSDETDEEISIFLNRFEAQAKIHFSDFTRKFAEMLLKIGISRKQYKLNLENIGAIKKFPLYSEITKILNDMNNNYSHDFLVYVIIAINYLDSISYSNMMESIELQSYYSLFYSNKYFMKLVNAFEKQFEFSSNTKFMMILINFIKKTYLDLQLLIPETSIYKYTKKAEKYDRSIRKILFEWNKEIPETVHFSEMHLRHFVVSMSEIITESKHIIIKMVVRNYVDYFVVESQIKKQFGEQVIIDQHLYSNIESVNNYINKEDTIILVNKEMINLNKYKECQNIIVVDAMLSDKKIDELTVRLRKK